MLKKRGHPVSAVPASEACPVLKLLTYLLTYYVCETNAQVDEEEAEAVGSSERRYQNRLSAAHQEKETRF